jgi:hypothetical protein
MSNFFMVKNKFTLWRQRDAYYPVWLPCVIILFFIEINNMNFKKLFAVVAGVSLIAQTMLSMVPVRAATFSAELEDAYAYAYEMGVTTMSPIENANMYGAITRAEMSKMIANRAEEVLGLKADTSASCVFNDTASVKGDLAGTIIKACQMGLMGQGITSFRPYDTVSRAEFGTILSRALWGDEYDG